MEILKIALETSVTLMIEEMKSGRRTSELTPEQTSRVASLITEHGDKMLYRPDKKGQGAEVFNELANVIACLAFQPNGITIFDMHFEVHSTQKKQ